MQVMRACHGLVISAHTCKTDWFAIVKFKSPMAAWHSKWMVDTID